MHYSDFLKVEDWKILDHRIFHFYNEDETAFGAVCVQIGTLVTYKTTISGSELIKEPIIRWIPTSEYLTLMSNCGEIVF